MVDTVKKRITRKDWDSIQQFILDELETRKRSKERKRHSNIWKEVDRQVYMEGMSRTKRDKNDPIDWRNAVELGELSRASEVIAADVRRLTFPTTRSWFDPHVEVDPDEDGINVDLQTRVDGRQRAFMAQQHIDFGFKSRVDLSVKEALHHGSYVVTAEWESMIPITDGNKVGSVSAPVWVPHSMWNSYPDPSIGGDNTFYQGSMITAAYKPAYQVKRMKSPDPKYPYFNLNKIQSRTNQREQAEPTDDVELITYRGDLVIPRSSGRDILLLNSKATLANGTIIHYMPNPFPYPPVIYNGWERLDVRDPYYISPLVKFSVTQKLGSIMANRLVDSIDLKVEPPIMYDGNDPDFVMNGGPNIAPGSKNKIKGTGSYTVMNDLGDPDAALAGTQFFIGQIEAGTKVDRVRSGVSPGTEQTATEVIKQSQNAELSTIDFVDKHENHGLRPFLYMQDFLNTRNLTPYKFYNQEMDAQDFETMKKSELPPSVHYDIVGSKGLLGEEQRQAQTSEVTAFWINANRKLLNEPELAKEMYRDAGNKNPERFLNVGDEAEEFQQQIQQVIVQAEQQIQALQQQMQEFTFQDEEHSLEIEQKELEKEQLQTKIGVLQGLLRIETAVNQAETQNESA